MSRIGSMSTGGDRCWPEAEVGASDQCQLSGVKAETRGGHLVGAPPHKLPSATEQSLH